MMQRKERSTLSSAKAEPKENRNQTKARHGGYKAIYKTKDEPRLEKNKIKLWGGNKCGWVTSSDKKEMTVGNIK
jgi:hypothetical protein